MVRLGEASSSSLTGALTVGTGCTGWAAAAVISSSPASAG